MGRHTRQAITRRKRKDTETSEYVAMLIRILYGWGQRVADDSAALTHLRDIEAALRDSTNLGIYGANKLNETPYSLSEMAAILGITKQSVHPRSGLGQQVYQQLAEAKARGAVVSLANTRAARAERLAHAGIPDRTGSVKEITAGRHAAQP